MGNSTSYHNVRDKNGRFAPKSVAKKSASKRGVSKKVDNKAREIIDMFILDRSGSMASIKDETIKGFNTVLNTNKTIARDTKTPSFCSLIQFDYNYDININYLNSKVEDCKELDNSSFIPRGMTALHDAIGFGINTLKEKLAELGKLGDKNVQVTVTVLTDGLNNHSVIHTEESIKSLVNEMKDKYNWTINYIGAGKEADVKKTAQNLGFFASNTVSYTADSLGTQAVFSSYNSSRSAKSKSFVKTGENKNFGFFSQD